MDSKTRNKELLRIARQSRVRWVNEGNHQHDRQRMLSTTGTENNNPNNASLEKWKSNVPVSRMVQEVLDLFNTIIDDGDSVDFESIISLSQLDEGMDEDPNDENNNEAYLLEALLTPPSSQSTQSNISLASISIDEKDYDFFIKRLRHPLSKDIVNSMRQYCNKFDVNVKNVDKDNKFAIKDNNVCKLAEEMNLYLDNVWTMMKSCQLWEKETEEQFTRSKLCAEKFLYHKLYSHLFTPNADDKLLDQKLQVRIKSLAFLLPEHLDLHMFLNRDYKQIMAEPLRQLEHMMVARSPVDKLSCLKACTQAISKELTALMGKEAAGADTFLPIMILLLKELCPAHLQSNIHFLQRFTNPAKLTSEFGYLFTYFISAVQFLESVDASALTISPQEFEMSIKRCREMATQPRVYDHKSSSSSSSSHRQDHRGRLSVLTHGYTTLPSLETEKAEMIDFLSSIAAPSNASVKEINSVNNVPASLSLDLTEQDCRDIWNSLKQREQKTYPVVSATSLYSRTRVTL